MKLTDEQKSAVAAWFAAGASLDEIQKRMASEFGVHATYLDLRLFVADLPQPEEAEEDGGGQGAGRPASGDADFGEAGMPPAQGDAQFGEAGVPPADGGGQGTGRPTDGDAEDDLGAAGRPADGDAAPAGGVSVSLDPITPAGVMAAGGVTFSDGTSGKWYLDRYGRLGLSGLAQGYRPSPEDGALFQSRLVELLQSKGLM